MNDLRLVFTVRDGRLGMRTEQGGKIPFFSIVPTHDIYLLPFDAPRGSLWNRDLLFLYLQPGWELTHDGQTEATKIIQLSDGVSVNAIPARWFRPCTPRPPRGEDAPRDPTADFYYITSTESCMVEVYTMKTHSRVIHWRPVTETRFSITPATANNDMVCHHIDTLLCSMFRSYGVLDYLPRTNAVPRGRHSYKWTPTGGRE